MSSLQFMSGLQITFEQPWYLLLLLLIPLTWLWSFRSLSGLGRFRRLLALGLRNLVLLLLILALADLHLLRRSDRLTVIYLLDQSASIPAPQRDEMVTYVIEEVQRNRNAARGDRAGVIVFGRDASIEVPPLEDDLPLTNRLDTVANLRVDATNLEAAMKLAQATFPEDSARRIVIVSDGNETIGNAAAVARQLAHDGIGIDVVPIWLQRDRDVAVERLAIPADARQGQPFEARIVVNNLTEPTADDDGTVSGKLRVVRKQGGFEQVLDESPVSLAPGKRVFSFTDKLESADFYEYSAEFVPDDPSRDAISQNNLATSYTQVRGRGRVLLLEDWQNRDADGGNGEFGFLVKRLREMELEVTHQFSDQLFNSLAQLQRYDTIVLANVPRSSGTTADDLAAFSDAQIDMLVRNTQQMGCGLVMLGGPNSFGPGGWTNTELEKAMPVDFRIENVKVKAIGALAMVMHASEIPEGNYWQKVIAREALKALGPQDFAAVIQWDNFQGRESWLWGGRNGFLPVGGNARMMVARLDRMVPGDMPDFEPSLQMAAAAFSSLDNVSVRHMICISDGDPNEPRAGTLARLKQMGVQVTTVAVGAHGPPGHRTLQRIANATGGKYYVVRSPNALPRIYQQEARRVARPLIVERDLQPQLTAPHEITQGIDQLPPIRGFVMTTRKENPLVEVAAMSPYPSTPENGTLLASWTYGLGRTAVLTTDAGARWATDWTGWEDYDKLFGQLIRWSMRPSEDTGQFSVATNIQDDKTEIVLDALDKNDEFLNFLEVSASGIGPKMESFELAFRQVAPGRYIAEVDTPKDGNYFVTILPGPRQPVLRAGFSIPYSAEFRHRQTNIELLKQLANTSPRDGAAGQLRGPTPAEGGLEAGFSVNSFRDDLARAISSNYVWPWLLLIAAVTFFGDVFVRRVALDFAWLKPVLARLLGKSREEAAPEAELARLRSRKAAVSSEWEQRHATARFEMPADATADRSTLEQAVADTDAPSGIQRPDSSIAPTAEEESFTSRLLKAKQEAHKKRDDTSDSANPGS